MKGRTDREAHQLVLEIAEKLHGLNMLEVDYTLSEARKLLAVTTFADVTSLAFTDQVRAFNKTFGTNHETQSRQ